MRSPCAVALVLLAGCTAPPAPPRLVLPAAEVGRVRIVAARLEALGEVQPIAVAATSAHEGALRLDPRQVFAHGGDPALGPDAVRVAPLPPGEAARRAGGARLPGAVRSTATGAAAGGLRGAATGAVSGAIAGGVGIGSAIGAAVGAIGGALGAGGSPPPDVEGF